LLLPPALPRFRGRGTLLRCGRHRRAEVLAGQTAQGRVVVIGIELRTTFGIEFRTTEAG
jgi:hypothetical protein